MYSYVAQTISGSKKKLNEDRIFINGHILDKGEYTGSSETVFALVCDGVGGENGGECAASIAASDCLVFDHNENSLNAIIRHLVNINEDIHDLQNNYYYFRKMSTTIAGLYMTADNFWFFNLGDTRIYQFTGGELTLLSSDHTLAAQMLKNGTISSMDEATKVEQNTITKYLGGRGAVSRSSVKNRALKRDNILFLICSDGIYKGFKDIAELQCLLESEPDIQSKKEAIVQHALHNGSTDDKSIIIISSD